MNYWLMKTEPETFSWDDLVNEGKTTWDGVRNYAARNNMQAMKKGDKVLIYHSIKGKNVVGIAKVEKEAYPDPTIDDDRWVAVDVVPFKKLNHPVSLEKIKKEPFLQNIGLVRIGRLSVMPLSKEEFDLIVKMSQKS